jgi:gluconokinase
MGVSGCGKTSVGERLSAALGWPFYDGDDFHPPENVAKMAAGQPLNDADRAPWLRILHDMIADHIDKGESLLLACSALKERYRQQLSAGISAVIFIHLKGSFDLIYSRMQARSGHYMKAEMLRSQFATLEEPQDALTIDIRQNLDTITTEIITYLLDSGEER